MTEIFFHQYLADYHAFKPYWNYEDGCVLLGCERMYRMTGKEEYAAFLLQYLNERIASDGTIRNYPESLCSLDSFQSSKALFFAWQHTGELRYRLAIHKQAAEIEKHPRTDSGMFWHKRIYPQQIWLDGIYMTAPFFSAYAEMNGDTGFFSLIRHQFRYLRNNLRNPENGLYYHGLDESRSQKWADPETGCSSAFWLRGMGWLLMALTDTAVFLPSAQSAIKRELSEMLKDAVDALLSYRAENGLFYQVIDRADAPGNYTETSGSLMAAYAMMCGAGTGMLPGTYYETGLSVLNTVKAEKMRRTDSGILLTDICASAGLGGDPYRDGSCAYYLSEPVVSNDPKGVGILMSAEAAARAYNPDTAEG
ncbi:MAG: glycoside hydrolase family 88 protein [Oscillospiraceae bacterium]|nr:glycoside hydrolase family 88 protein [Oscillospiraceae bacterium]